MKKIIQITKNKLNNEDNEDLSKLLLKNWTNWKWQVKNTIRKIEDVEKILDIKFPQEKRNEIEETIEKFPMAITPYYLSLVDADNYENDAVFKQCFPNIKELSISTCDMQDPLSEDEDSPVPGITHRYPDRVLFHVSNICAMYCRHCTRKRKVGDIDSVPSKRNFNRH